MAENVHLLGGGTTRLTVRAYKSWWDLGFYIHVAWGGSRFLKHWCRAELFGGIPPHGVAEVSSSLRDRQSLSLLHSLVPMARFCRRQER